MYNTSFSSVERPTLLDMAHFYFIFMPMCQFETFVNGKDGTTSSSSSSSKLWLCKYTTYDDNLQNDCRYSFVLRTQKNNEFIYLFLGWRVVLVNFINNNLG